MDEEAAVVMEALSEPPLVLATGWGGATADSTATAQLFFDVCKMPEVVVTPD